MTAERYICCDERRRAALAAPGAPLKISGIDYVEVTQGETVADPVAIEIVLVKPLDSSFATLTAANISITGGVRFPAPKPKDPVVPSPAVGQVSRFTVTLPGNQPTDFSTYRLALVAGEGQTAPPNFIDPRLSAVDFSFKAGCASDFDCAPDCAPEPPDTQEPPFVDYRVRDWPGFRRQMLDRLSKRVPGFREDDAVDLTTTLIEALAYRADQQSYRLDWVGTEAFLTTARSPMSLARLARLVDYRPGQGVSARVSVAFDFTPDASHGEGFELPKGSPLLGSTDGLGPQIKASDYRGLLAHAPVVFETMNPLSLWSWRTHMAFHTWSDSECILPRGATAATLVDTGGGAGPLVPGDFLILSQTRSPETGEHADADPTRRHLVRILSAEPVKDVLDNTLKLVTVHWDAEDALPFDLVLSARVFGQSGAEAATICAEAAANVTLADHGASLPPRAHLDLTPAEIESARPVLSPSEPETGFVWRPTLDQADLAQIAPADFSGPPDARAFQTAAQLMRIDPASCLPAFTLADDFAIWDARADLLASSLFDRDFVVETGIDGRAGLRFGDGAHGLAPAPGAQLVPSGRFGFGPSGNLGHDALAHVVLRDADADAHIVVRNPLTAQGGAAAEPASAVRVAAPEAYRVQDRAITPDDYAAAARRHPEVANAVAIARWTGAWQSLLVYVDRRGGPPVDAAFRAELLAHLEHFRMMGVDVALRGARPAPLAIDLKICADLHHLRSAVAARVRAALRPDGPADGSNGFFHPDNLTFGAPLYLSRLIAACMAVDGVESVKPLVFQRLGRPPADEIALGVIRPGEAEVLQLADDPSFPERGQLTLTMGGGR